MSPKWATFSKDDMITEHTLPNGIRVVMQPMKDFHSVSMGVWVSAGVVYENEAEAGISHFIEHMLFKGTKNRSAQTIAAEMDALGGNLNAFTAKECTCYYTKVLDEHVEKSVESLSDILQNSLLANEDIEKEKGVVCEEILMTEDTPEDLVHDIMATEMYGEAPLGKAILGTEQSVRALDTDMLRSYMSRRYVSRETVIAAAGRFEEQNLIEALTPMFGQSRDQSGEREEQSALRGGRGLRAVEKDIEQVHICLSVPAFAADTMEQYALLVLNNVLGGSMSSRLFQSIREERGLAYSVYAYPSAFSDNGYYTLYAGTGEKQAGEVVKLMIAELVKLKKDGISKEELERAKEQLKASYVIGQESTSARANSIGKAAIRRNAIRSEEEVLSRIEKVDMESIEQILPVICNLNDLRGAFVGKMSKQEREIERMILQTNC